MDTLKINRESDQLERASNFNPSKSRLQMPFEEVELWRMVEGKATILMDHQ